MSAEHNIEQKQSIDTLSTTALENNFAVLAESIDAISARDNAINQTLEEVLTKIFEDTDQIRDQFEVNPPSSAVEALDRMKPFMEHDTFVRLSALANEQRELTPRQKKLETHAAKVAHELLKPTQTALINRVDWDTAFSKFTEFEPRSENYEHFLNIIRSLQLENDIAPSSYRSLYNRYTTIRDGAYLFDQLDVTKEVTDPQHEVNEVARTDINDLIDPWLHETDRVTSSFLSLSRKQNLTVPYDTFGKYQHLARAMGSHTPEVMEAALHKNIKGVFDAFDQSDLLFLKQHESLRSNSLLVSHQELLKQTTMIENPLQTLTDWRNEFPDWYSNGLGFVDISPNIKHEIADEQGMKTIEYSEGTHSGLKNRIKLSTNTDSFNSLLENHPEISKAILRSIWDKEIRRTFHHELTHYAHQRTIPITWLREWYRITQIEKVAVTPYVATFAEKPETQSSEDLAETVMLFKDQPATLYFKAPERFICINKLLNEFPEWIITYLNKRAIDTEEKYHSLVDSVIEEDRLLPPKRAIPKTLVSLPQSTPETADAGDLGASETLDEPELR